MTRRELSKIGEKLGINCGGKGGKPGPCPTGDQLTSAALTATKTATKLSIKARRGTGKYDFTGGSVADSLSEPLHRKETHIVERLGGASAVHKSVAFAHDQATESHIRSAESHKDEGRHIKAAEHRAAALAHQSAAKAHRSAAG